MIVTTPNETKFYVTNTVSGSVSVIDRSTGEVKVLATGPGTEGIAISPDGKEVWAASRIDDKIADHFDGHGFDRGGISQRREGAEADGLSRPTERRFG